jgi:hypothetical protein
LLKKKKKILFENLVVDVTNNITVAVFDVDFVDYVIHW